MADTQLHLLMTLGGGYKSTDAEDQPEVWQTNLRMVISHNTIEPVGIIPTEYSVVEDEQTVSTAAYTVTSNWRLEGGVNDWDPVSYIQDQGLAYALAWFNQTAISAYAQGFWLKVFAIGPDGKAIAPPGFSQGSPCLLTWTEASRLNGNGSSNTLPLQCSVVASHRTAQTGKKGRGRQFLPAIDQNSITAGGRLTSDARTACLNAQVAALEAASMDGTLTNPFVYPSVISSGSGSPSGLTRYAVINGVRVGDVIDTQRRRRNRLVESYASADVSY